MRTACFRYSNYGTALRALPGQRPGRFNDVDDPPTQYLAEHPLAPWAEFLRWAPSAPAGGAAVRLWALRVDLDDLVHVDFDNAADFGLTAERLVSDDDYSDCRDLAVQLRRAGAFGLVTPSAALPGSQSVVLFGGRVLTRFSHPAPDAEQVAGAMTADRSQPPVEILRLYRARGTPHAGLAAWQRGEAYMLPEPVAYTYP